MKSEFEIGDKIQCKKSLTIYDGEKRYKKNSFYEIISIFNISNTDIYVLLVKNNTHTMFGTTMFEYFYHKNELRKEKLLKLNGICS